MPPVIHCVRHAQGVHNLSHANHNILDPCLTDLGEKQSLDIANNYSGVFDDASLVLASPLRRTISTALLAFKTILGSYGKVLAWPAIQEASDLPCDTGSDVTELQAEFDSSSVDLTLVEPGWQIKSGKYASNSGSLLKRADDARNWLAERPEKEIVLVSHGCFLHFLTDDWVESTCSHMTSWKNTELRSYTFADGGDHGLYLKETPQSRERRGMAPLEPTLAERLQLRDESISSWVKWGVIS